MTTAEISRAKAFLKSFKPNVLKLASQNNEVVRALADGSAWIGITNLGTDDRVKDAGGPVVKTAYPKEGTIGFIDSEQIVKASKNKDAFEKFENTMQQAPWIAKNFLTNGRPLFNEKAYKILVNQGHGDRARRLLLQQAGERPQDDDQGPGRRRAGLRRRLQRGVRRLDRWLRRDVGDSRLDPAGRRALPEGSGEGPRRRAGFGRLGQYAGFMPAIVLFGAVLRRPARADRRVQLLDSRRLQRRPRLDARQLPLLLQRRDVRARRCWATIWVSVAATALTIAIAFPFAYWLVRYVPRRLQSVLLVLVILPFWTSYLLRVYSWLNILGERGAINRFLQWTHLTDHPLSLFLYDRPAVILVLAYLYFPFAALTLYASLERFDWDQFKAAMDLGAQPAGRDPQIMLPQIKPGITTAVIFVFIPDPRRVPDAAARRRRARGDDREPDRQLLLRRPVHARSSRGAARSRR